MVVSGPLVRFSLSTSVVAAGAVAEEMAPSMPPMAMETGTLPVIAMEIVVTRMVTTMNGIMASIIRMPTNCFPYFFMVAIFSSPPIIKPIRVRAMLESGVSVVTTSALSTWRPDWPISMPITIYPTTWGILSFWNSLPPMAPRNRIVPSIRIRFALSTESKCMKLGSRSPIVPIIIF